MVHASTPVRPQAAGAKGAGSGSFDEQMRLKAQERKAQMEGAKQAEGKKVSTTLQDNKKKRLSKQDLKEKLGFNKSTATRVRHAPSAAPFISAAATAPHAGELPP